MLIRLIFILFLSSQWLLQAQILKEFEIKQEKVSGSIPVLVSFPDAVILTVHSAIQGLSFESNLSEILYQKTDGTKITLAILAEKQFITVKARNFREAKIEIQKLDPKSHLQFRIDEKLAGAPDIPIAIITTPDSARIYIDSVFAGIDERHKTKAGLKKIRIEKDGYFPLDTIIVVSLDNTLFRFTLQKAEEILVSIKSKPEGAYIYLNEKAEGGMTDKQKYLLPGNHSLRLTKTGYLDTSTVITVDPGRQNEFVFDLIKNEAVLDISLSPSDAMLTINNTEYQPGRIELQPGKYIVEITRSGYLAQKDTVILALASRISRSYNLVKNAATLNISLEPFDAELFVDGVKRQSGSIEVTPGQRIIDVTRRQYIPVRDTIQAALGSVINKTIRLEKNTGFLAITAPSFEFVFTIDGKNASYSSRLELEAGRYLLKAEKMGYYPWQQSVTVKRGETQNIAIDLQPVTGTIQFSVSPADAEFRLSQNDQVKYQWKGAARRDDIPAGEYGLIVSLPQYEDYLENVTVAPKEILKRDINLKKILTQEERNRLQTGKLLVQVEPPQAEVRLYRDGVLLHEWRGSRILDELQKGDYDLECYLYGYHTYTGEVTVIAGQTTDAAVSLKKIDLTAGIQKPWYTQWYYYAAGAAVGIVAAILIMNQNEEENPRETLVTSPGRP